MSDRRRAMTTIAALLLVWGAGVAAAGLPRVQAGWEVAGSMPPFTPTPWPTPLYTPTPHPMPPFTPTPVPRGDDIAVTHAENGAVGCSPHCLAVAGHDAYVAFPFAAWPGSGIFLVHSSDAGKTWGQPTQVPGSGASGGATTVARRPGVRPGDLNLYMASYQIPPPKIVFYHTPDGGATWESQVLYIGNPISDNLSSPLVELDRRGTIYVTWGEQERHRYVITRSTDDGRTWSPLVPVHHDPHFYPGMDPHTVDFAVLGGTLYLNWYGQDTHTPSTFGIYVARSTDGGRTWGDPVRVDGLDDGVKESTKMTVDAAGTVYVAWSNHVPGGHADDERVYFSRSTDGGQSWSAALRIDDAPYCPLNPDPTAALVQSLYYDEATATLYASYTDGRNYCWPGSWNADLFYTYSTDGGKTWAASRQVSDPLPNGNLVDQAQILIANGMVYNIFNGDHPDPRFPPQIWLDLDMPPPPRTPTPLPTASPTPASTATSTPTPTPTSTPTLTATSTPSPTTTVAPTVTPPAYRLYLPRVEVAGRQLGKR